MTQPAGLTSPEMDDHCMAVSENVTSGIPTDRPISGLICAEGKMTYHGVPVANFASLILPADPGVV